MLKVIASNRFDKNINLAKKRGKNLAKAETIIELIRSDQPLPAKLKDHALIGNYKGTRELKIEPDWLLIYYIEDGVLYLFDTGTHSDLFKK